MDTLKILAHIHLIPDNNHPTVFLINNLLPVFRQYFNVKLFWVIHRPERVNVKSKESELTYYDIHDFKNAVEIVDRLKPDLIFDNEFPSLLDFAFSQAGKHRNIPVIQGLYKEVDTTIGKLAYAKSGLFGMFNNDYLGDTINQEKKTARKGKFFIYKYIFLLKTVKACRWNIFKIIKYFFVVLNTQIFLKRPFVDSRFADALHWSAGEYFIQPYLKDSGYDKSTLIVTGNPIFDIAFQQMQQIKKDNIHSKKLIRILFLPTTNYEVGLMSKKERDQSVISVIEELSKFKDRFEIIIKLHPSSHLYRDYEKMIHSIDPDIPIYQKGNIIDYFSGIDLVLAFTSGSSSLTYALISKIPILLYDFTKSYKSWLLDNELSYECQNVETLIPLLEKTLQQNPATESKLQNYISKYFYKADGKSSQRLVDAILKIINKPYSK